MFSDYLNCTLCKDTFESRESWLRHLLAENHQIAARRECRGWGTTTKQCALVIYSSASLMHAEKLLEYFSYEENNKISNFIWWPDRERVGILVFESPEKVKNVFRTLGGQRLQLSNYDVDFKEAVSCLDLEWIQLLHQDFTEEDYSHPTESLFTENTVFQADNTEEKPMQRLHHMDFSVENGMLGLKPDAPSEVINSNSTSDRVDSVLRLDCGVIITECSSTATQFVRLFKSIGISEERLKILEFIRTALGAEYEVNMYRNWYLNFGMSELDTLLVHVYIDNTEKSDGFTVADNEVVQNELLMEIGKTSSLKGYIRDEKYIYSNPATEVTFSVKTDPLGIVEVQMCRLVQYYCNFDPRVRPLLGLVYFWAKENFKSLPHQSYLNILSPAALDWLVILFLCKSGLLPSVREILTMPHKPIIVRDYDGESHDIGFDADPKFVEKWKRKLSPTFIYEGLLDKEHSDQFIIELLGLMRDFLEFIGSLMNGEWVLNTKDGEVYNLENFLKDEPGSTWSTKLPKDEVFRIRYYNDRNMFYMQGSGLTLMHPLLLTWKIELSQGVLRHEAGTVVRKTIDYLSYSLNALETRPDKMLSLRDILIHVGIVIKKCKREKKKQNQAGEKRRKLGIDGQDNSTMDSAGFEITNDASIFDSSYEEQLQREFHSHEDQTVSSELVCSSLRSNDKGSCTDLENLVEFELDCGVIITRCSPHASQFLRIIESIKISEEKLQIQDLIRTTLGTEYEVNLYRNWYLNVGKGEVDTLMVHVHVRSDNTEGFTEASLDDVKSKLEKDLVDQRFKQKGGKKKSNTSFSYYSNSITGATFFVQTDPKLMVEVQTCQLVQYFCSFDPRVRAMLSLVYFWARENNIDISSNRGENECYRGPPALDWLVIHYLCKSGILPTVRDVLDRPHKPILVCDDDGVKHDVGFHADPVFAEEWRQGREQSSFVGRLDKDLCDIFIQQVLDWMKSFFQFLSSFKNGKWVLNPKDAEVYSHDHFWNDEPGTTWNTKLTRDEIMMIRLHGNKSMQNENDSLTFLHPLMLTRRISILQKQLRGKKGAGNRLRHTGHCLKSFFDKVKSRPGKYGNIEKVLGNLSGKDKNIKSFKSNNQSANEKQELPVKHDST